jgi:hypothetical protein
VKLIFLYSTIIQNKSAFKESKTKINAIIMNKRTSQRKHTSLHIETNGGNCGYNLTEFEFVQDGGLACRNSWLETPTTNAHDVPQLLHDVQVCYETTKHS